ncbi:MAG: DUF2268 domain-containing putative Zn-dependent protease, partial [Cryomorphaceae bacterium]
FITEDIPRFWEGFDQLDTVKKPFKDYVKTGSPGLQDFIDDRIVSAKHLTKTVKAKKKGYENIRAESLKVEESTERIRQYYQVFKEKYDAAVFPPTYFVIGAFNSGGTSSDNGLIIGVEMQTKVSDIPYIVAHELIHFNQNYPKPRTLLDQSIMEGVADFVGELISGDHINHAAFDYGNANEEALCREFVAIMNDGKYHGWLYGTMGKKEGRPNDLGYWIGYQIAAAYYEKADDKKQALKDILNIRDYQVFLNQSEYLSPYMSE